MRYARAYAYDTADPTYSNAHAYRVQATDQWLALVVFLYKLNIVMVLY